jgi:23S rRNA (cytosine1962-C5)-methyltransferase
MQTLPRLRLKKGKEKPILQHHHWIYSGAVASSPEGGPLAQVESSSGEILGIAMLNQGHSIAAHMIAFGQEPLEEALKNRIGAALELRRRIFDPAKTNAIRLINAEGDGIPGLIVDSYANVLVLQISHPGLEGLKDVIVSLLIEACRPKAIYEKSTSFLRKKSGLEEVRGTLYGADCPEVEVLENGLKFAVDIQTGQKTGLFLDQREMRSLVREHGSGRRILNGFAYTGAFSVAALAGGATHVDSVEISARCKAPLEKNLGLNGFSNHEFIEADFFEFLKTSPLAYDLIILDPPAFVKKRNDIATGFRAYKELNRHVLAKMPPCSLLLTCSCSYHVDEPLFQNILFRAALESGRRVKILSRHRQALDHPVSLFHPESLYLKSFLLYVQ